MNNNWKMTSVTRIGLFGFIFILIAFLLMVNNFTSPLLTVPSNINTLVQVAFFLFLNWVRVTAPACLAAVTFILKEGSGVSPLRERAADWLRAPAVFLRAGLLSGWRQTWRSWAPWGSRSLTPSASWTNGCGRSGSRRVRRRRRVGGNFVTVCCCCVAGKVGVSGKVARMVSQVSGGAQTMKPAAALVAFAHRKNCCSLLGCWRKKSAAFRLRPPNLWLSGGKSLSSAFFCPFMPSSSSSIWTRF